MIPRGLALAALALALASPTQGHAQDGMLMVMDAWARATPPKAQTAAIYLSVMDHGAPDRLTGASTPIASAATLHENSTKDGIMQMRPVDALDVSAENPIALTPGGFHLMLTGLAAPLLAGQTFPITLSFEKAGAITTTVTVRKIGAGNETKGQDMKGMDMPSP